MTGYSPSPSKALRDSQGRILTYLRISVTDACNYQCRYCGPQQSHGILKDKELFDLCRIFRDLGIETLRITGGEPMVRKGLTPLIASIAQLGFARIGMTTNGSLLAENALSLAQAGLDGVNISIDATDPALFALLSGGYEVRPVLSGIEKALDAGLQVKLNCVPLLDTYQVQIPQVMRLARTFGIPIRFIELMPIGKGSLCKGVPFETLHTYIQAHYGDPKVLANADFGSDGPAQYKTYGEVVTGTIEALSSCFCATCNRLRLTSNGLLRNCLYHEESLNLLSLLEAKQKDEQIEDTIRQFITRKPPHHDFALQGRPSCSLASIGG